MTTRPYLLLDAGGTIVFIEQDYLSQLASQQGYSISGEQIYDEHFRLIHWLDNYVLAHGRFPPALERPYAQVLFEGLGMDADAAACAGEETEIRQRERSLWNLTFPWVREALERLTAAGYRMSIISNADGRVQQKLHDMELSGYFERVYDSHVVGSEKPDAAIFELALQELGLRPDETLYIGDIFYIDVWGANRAGIGALHLDPLGLYGGWPGVHIRDLSQALPWLERCGRVVVRNDLLPLRGFTLTSDRG